MTKFILCHADNATYVRRLTINHFPKYMLLSKALSFSPLPSHQFPLLSTGRDPVFQVLFYYQPVVNRVLRKTLLSLHVDSLILFLQSPLCRLANLLSLQRPQFFSFKGFCSSTAVNTTH